MTNQEVIERMKYRIKTATDIAGKGVDGKSYEDMEIAIKALEEIQKYRQIGTVQEIQSMKAELARWHTDRLNDRIKNEFAYMSTLICHNCDHKDDYIEELEADMDEYKAIGTVEECREAMEKQKAKKPIKIAPCKSVNYFKCSACGEFLSIDKPFCAECGNAVDWSEL